MNISLIIGPILSLTCMTPGMAMIMAAFISFMLLGRNASNRFRTFSWQLAPKTKKPQLNWGSFSYGAEGGNR